MYNSLLSYMPVILTYDQLYIITIIIFSLLFLNISFIFVYSILILVPRRFHHPNNIFILNICLNIVSTNYRCEFIHVSFVPFIININLNIRIFSYVRSSPCRVITYCFHVFCVCWRMQFCVFSLIYQLMHLH